MQQRSQVGRRARTTASWASCGAHGRDSRWAAKTASLGACDTACRAERTVTCTPSRTLLQAPKALTLFLSLCSYGPQVSGACNESAACCLLPAPPVPLASSVCRLPCVVFPPM